MAKPLEERSDEELKHGLAEVSLEIKRRSSRKKYFAAAKRQKLTS